MSAVETFVDEVARLSFAHTFNPYRDVCEVFDYAESPGLRRELLLRTLKAASREGVDCLWIGRDLGYRGGRRTGLALTDQVHVGTHLRRWGITNDRTIVKGEAQAERTASVIWKMLDQISNSVFLWNVFPLHPHAPGQQFTNRAHTAKERGAGEDILKALVKLLRPTTIVAIGQDAEKSAQRCGGTNVFPVRHPSYGGLREFESAVTNRYGL